MQLLAYRDPTGRVYILNESQALPALAKGFEWTMVVKPEVAQESEPTAEPAPRRQSRSFLDDVLMPLLTPRSGQSPEERAKEVITAIPEDVRAQVGKVVRAFKKTDLPPFPGA